MSEFSEFNNDSLIAVCSHSKDGINFGLPNCDYAILLLPLEPHLNFFMKCSALPLNWGRKESLCQKKTTLENLIANQARRNIGARAVEVGEGIRPQEVHQAPVPRANGVGHQSMTC
jgi:hypothetical protein